MKLRNKKLANPFIYQGYESPEYFCDREVETKTLMSHLKNGRNVTLISPRRLGKTGLSRTLSIIWKKMRRIPHAYTLTYSPLRTCTTLWNNLA